MPRLVFASAGPSVLTLADHGDPLLHSNGAHILCYGYPRTPNSAWLLQTAYDLWALQ